MASGDVSVLLLSPQQALWVPFFGIPPNLDMTVMAPLDRPAALFSPDGIERFGLAKVLDKSTVLFLRGELCAFNNCLFAVNHEYFTLRAVCSGVGQTRAFHSLRSFPYLPFSLTATPLPSLLLSFLVL